MRQTAPIKILTAIFLFFVFANVVFAQTSWEEDSFDVDINANINQDLYSQLSLSSATVEILQPSTVNITILDANGNPLYNHTIQIYINGSSTGVTITQPSKTNLLGQTSGTVRSSISGAYEVCAMDITGSTPVYIIDCETLYVVPVPIPTMLSEPQYTQGTTNNIMWSTSGTSTYSYYSESSTSDTFSQNVVSSGWISSTSYTFNNLSNGQIYFYRVKARNTFGAESSWSNSVYSVQDSSNPSIVLLSVSGLGENNTKEWNAQDVITFKFKVTDNIGIDTRTFQCVSQANSVRACSTSDQVSGNIWEVQITLDQLETDTNYYLYTEYSFCAEAVDMVGNVTRICNISLSVPEPEAEVRPSNPIIEKAKDIVEKIIKNTREILDNTIGNIEQKDIVKIVFTVALANLFVGIGLLLNGVGTIPYFILQFFISILGLFGFKKKGHHTGYVYDSVTKEPVPQAIVRIFNENNELVWTDVTDSNGYFKTENIPAGEYSIKITARGYSFPSKIVFGRTDFPLERVYHGQEFYVSNGTIPNFSIPVDSTEMSVVKKSLSRFFNNTKILWKLVYIVMFLGGLLLSAYALYINPVFVNYVILLLYIPALYMVIYSFFNKRERYGIVRDEEGKRAEGVIVGLKDAEFDTLISKRVTDKNGRYRFIIGKGVFSLSVLSSEWMLLDDSKVEKISVKKKNGEVLAINLRVQRVHEKKVYAKRKKDVENDVVEPLGEL